MALMKILYSSYIYEPDHVRFDGEDSNEKVILCLRRHFITNLGWILISISLFIVPFFVQSFLEFNGIDVVNVLPVSYKFLFVVFWYVFAFGYLFTSFLGWYFNAYLVTNKRLVDIDFEGLIHRRFSEAFLLNIEDLTNQVSGAVQVVFNYGTLHVQTAGEMKEIEFEKIPRPAKVQDIISDLSSEVRRIHPNNA